jgi:hypothetical protein
MSPTGAGTPEGAAGDAALDVGFDGVAVVVWLGVVVAGPVVAGPLELDGPAGLLGPAGALALPVGCTELDGAALAVAPGGDAVVVPELGVGLGWSPLKRLAFATFAVFVVCPGIASRPKLVATATTAGRAIPLRARNFTLGDSSSRSRPAAVAAARAPGLRNAPSTPKIRAQGQSTRSRP